jgi:hypothetical protein
MILALAPHTTIRPFSWFRFLLKLNQRTHKPGRVVIGVLLLDSEFTDWWETREQSLLRDCPSLEFGLRVKLEVIEKFGVC